MKTKKYLVVLGSSGFPYGLADVQKTILISKSLITAGNDVTIICRKGVHNIKEYEGLQIKGDFQGIKYIYTSGVPFREDNFLKRNFLKIKGAFNEFLLIKNKSVNKKIDYAILSTENFYNVAYYCFLSKIFRFKTVLNYVEFNSGIKKKQFQILKKINDFLFDKYAIRIVDAIFPISEFLINQIEKTISRPKFLKIPVLTDIEKFNNIPITDGEKYYLFCGAAVYKEIIIFIIDAFTKLKNDFIKLYLVINGEEENIAEIKKHINKSNQRNNIKIFSKLEEKELFTFYKNAIALLIPLRPTLQDIARFPHKTGEYLASGNPIISTNYGEVKYYFRDGENMLLAETYDVQLFAEKMQFVIDNPDKAKRIGLEGKNMVIKLFDYRYKAKEIDEFLFWD